MCTLISRYLQVPSSAGQLFDLPFKGAFGWIGMRVREGDGRHYGGKKETMEDIMEGNSFVFAVSISVSGEAEWLTASVVEEVFRTDEVLISHRACSKAVAALILQCMRRIKAGFLVCLESEIS
ncbi:hypothetical protein Ancab_021630 [Ancistrocladus abbreviatus]